MVRGTRGARDHVCEGSRGARIAWYEGARGRVVQGYGVPFVAKLRFLVMFRP